MASSEEIEKRLALVEGAIANKGWSRRLNHALAKKLGVSTRQVRRYRQRIIDDLVDDDDSLPREGRRQEFLVRLRETIAQAQGAGKWGPAFGGLRMEMQVLGLDSPIEERGTNASGKELESEILVGLRALPKALLTKALEDD